MPTPVDLQNVFTRAVEVQRVQESLQQYMGNQQQHVAEQFRELQRRRLAQVRNTEAAVEGVIQQDQRQARHERESQRRRNRRRRAFMADDVFAEEFHQLDLKL